MKELLEILEAIDRYAAQGELTALATIVGVRGSTYRREGARLLLTQSQQMVGNISGGCLESDVMVVADEVMSTGQPRLVSYDLTADDDAVWGLGLGCNGAVDVFVEPVDPRLELFPLLRVAIAGEEAVSLVTVVEGAGLLGAHMVVRSDGSRAGSLGDAGLDDRATRAATAVLEEGVSKLQALPGPSGAVRAFVEALQPPVRLVVCGAGHDAIPLVQFASELGWRVVVVDQRERFLSRERFPGARQFVHAEPLEAGDRVPTDRRTYIVIMTHNYLHDRDLLGALLKNSASYVGMLGPKLRTQKILHELRQQGVAVSERDQARIFSPVGLDLGSEGPEEIALAIIGEILAVESGRRGGFLRDRTGPIHAEAKIRS